MPFKRDSTIDRLAGDSGDEFSSLLVCLSGERNLGFLAIKGVVEVLRTPTGWELNELLGC